ncbi:helix-turn-helix domain-containing protein [Bacillus sinesaloumensis]|uniref:helix-turn-helix domain-containing protein n=1 Tax=Litchfieldia sinesaloumensis TaxID=1926280 RepID=UPI0009883442|nr:helix-turn-helix domain-containing protein [Bacillus sinesaloumensis]
MLEIKLDDEEVKALFLAEVKSRLDKIESEALLMNSKQLCKYLSLSWPTVEKVFLSDPNFPRIRLGSKWLFPRKEVERYIDIWAMENQANADEKLYKL